ncbi:S-adenosylmethionine sensor upstream of mTORC1 [Sitophilus oryzae]|uniref:S-adenosylmethionine sensor upstream of mTORC1 n=1 Tax=Sitophilus oryzae TaxID=7048 RepID=A0A6J2YHX6_SITOR|nr:S-adenosylmethionine sensor upstream of mTORC1 [Sitophilus oryzae]
MTDDNQKTLAEFIKNTHRKLRDEAKILGTEQAWKNHCENKQHLNKYAVAMKSLAENFWDHNCSTGSKAISRIIWTYEHIKKYFSCIEKCREKELCILKRLKLAEMSLDKRKLDIKSKFKLLDVGSCYNPFKKFEIFDVTALDIAPASEDVLMCDFIHTEISDRSVIKSNVILQLEKESFDIVVFSLLLEYIPCPDLRLKCCTKAYELLKFEGILIIITPDSNHIGSNAKIIKSWKYVLSQYGFSRVYYDKLPHMHCMVFRKTMLIEIARRWAVLNKRIHDIYDKLYIPQDFVKFATKKTELPLNVISHWSQDTFLTDICLEDSDI